MKAVTKDEGFKKQHDDLRVKKTASDGGNRCDMRPAEIRP